jgi:glycosyltransferase involved in cell wall biosynthesis
MVFFSLIVPTYNRATVVGRTIDSVLSQDFADWEIVVVDSASTDDTRAVVQEYVGRDPRIRLITEETRRGVCPARNLAVRNAAGAWIIPLDSDDELAPNSLSLFARHIAAAPHVDHHRYMCRWDDGSTSPRPPLIDGEEWDYEGYLRFLERTAEGGNTEALSVVRASTFAHVRYPDDRSYEVLYHLELAARFRTKSHVEVGRLFHTDAPNQNSFVPNPRHWLGVAPDIARSLDQVVSSHGEALSRTAPRAWREILRSAAKYNFLRGSRRRAIELLAQYWRRRPLSPISWALFFFGMLGPLPLAWADSVRFRMHFRRTHR